MSKQENDVDGEAAGDARVSAAYRDLAGERTPPQLDRQVLHAARAAMRSRYGQSIRWTRPLAWAATIALCLAITLQFTQLPTPESPTADAVTAPAAPARQEAVALPTPLDKAASDAREAKQSRLPAQSVAPAPQRDADAVQQYEEAREDIAVTDAAAPDARPGAMLQRAEHAARLQQGATAAAGNELAAQQEPLRVGGEGPAPPACDTAARANPDSWLDCIEQLEKDGRSDAANRERDALAEAFPGFSDR